MLAVTRHLHRRSPGAAAIRAAQRGHMAALRARRGQQCAIRQEGIGRLVVFDRRQGFIAPGLPAIPAA